MSLDNPRDKERLERIHQRNQANFGPYIRRATWELAREHFAWAYPAGTALVCLAGIWAVQGWDKAMENIVPMVIGAIATVVVAVVAYGLPPCQDK
jgi:hypothetical protein